jgi:hypothetical protein
MSAQPRERLSIDNRTGEPLLVLGDIRKSLLLTPGAARSVVDRAPR